MPDPCCRYCNFVNAVCFWKSSPSKPGRRRLALVLGVFFLLVWLALAILSWPPSLDRWYEASGVSLIAVGIWLTAVLGVIWHIAAIVFVIGACDRCFARMFGFPRLW